MASQSGRVRSDGPNGAAHEPVPARPDDVERRLRAGAARLEALRLELAEQEAETLRVELALATRRLARAEAKAGLSADEARFAELAPGGIAAAWSGGADPVRDLRWLTRHGATRPLAPPQAPFDLAAMDLHWLFRPIGPGMGGPMTAFRLMRHLERQGHRNTIWIIDPVGDDYLRYLKRLIGERYVPLEADVRAFSGERPGEVAGDAVVATHWSTAYAARTVTAVRERFYLIQDFEPAFDAVGSRHLLAEETYRFGYRGIAASPWLRDLVRDRYGMSCTSFDLAVDHDIHVPPESGRRRPCSVAVYGRLETHRRAVEIALLGLDLLRDRCPDLEVHFFGGDPGPLDVPFRHVNHGRLAPADLAELYRTVEVGLVLSATNPSLVAREMMACALPVVELDGPGTRSLFSDGSALLCRPTPAAVAEAVASLLGNRDARQAQALRGLASVGDLSWERSGRAVEEALRSGIAERAPESLAPLARLAWARPDPRRRSGKRRGDEPGSLKFERPVLWVGQPEYFRVCWADDLAHHESSAEFAVTSADPDVLRRLPEAVERIGARTVVVFRPEWLARFPETVRRLRERGVALVAYSSEPVPHSWATAHPDQLQRLGSLLGARDVDWDLVIHYDRWSEELLREAGFRTLVSRPLPTSETLFFPEDAPAEFDLCFAGKSTAHREAFLMPLKARHTVLHVAHGLGNDRYRDLMNRSRLVLNLHNEPYPNFEQRVVKALFCGRPVLSEPLSGGYLEPGREVLEFRSPGELQALVARCLEDGPPETPPFDRSPWTVRAFTTFLGLD